MLRPYEAKMAWFNPRLVAQIHRPSSRAYHRHFTCRAFAFAADHFEQVSVAPVHVHVRLICQRTNPLELLERFLEALRADALHVLGERLAWVRTLCLIDLEDAVDGKVRFLGQNARHARGVLADAPVAFAADEKVVAGDFQLADLVGRSLQSNARHVMLTTAVGAAADLDAD